MTKQENFIALLTSTERDNVGLLLNWIKKHNFYSAPASQRNHNNMLGGLLKHSLEVCNEALYLWKQQIQNNPQMSNSLSKESVMVVSLLHDICKWNVYYISPYTGEPRCNRQAMAEGHGLKSLSILSAIGFPLTEDERMAIWWHMGIHEPSLKDYESEYEASRRIPLCNLIREADYNATHLKERFEKILDTTGINNADKVKHYLKHSNFYTTNSSSHHSYNTGLVAHSIGTYRHMMEIAGNLNSRDAATASLFHDIAMQNRSRRYRGHGYRSWMILKERLGVNISEEALAAVRFHKGSKKDKSAEEIALLEEAKQTEIWQKLYESDRFDADHDITDVYKHYCDEIF